jgi:hypothetical protein
VLDTPNPPFRAGRFHRADGQATWYGSSTERGAWAEFARSLPGGADPSLFQRRIGRVEFDLVVLDLTSPALIEQLGLDRADLVSDDLTVCELLADLASAAGFDAILGPSAATTGDTTLAVLGSAIRDKARRVVDRGIHSPPA